MEARNSDPYEQQLFAVFESCLEKGQSRLNEQGLKSLCEKLELEDQASELISSLLENSSIDSLISFANFRDGLLSLLGKSQDTESSGNNVHESFENRKLRKLCRINGQIINENMNSPEVSLVSTSFDNSTIPKQMIEQIFEKLDMDCDGLINFEEFLLLFQHGRNLQEQLNSDWNERSRGEAEITKTNLNMLGPDRTGYILSSSVINLWELAGVQGASNLLSDLGFSGPHISVGDLTSVLNEELKSLQHETVDPVIQTHVNLLKGALVLYQEEVRSMNTLVEQLTGERDKLRIDVIDANDRANLLAQEIDENHLRLEKSKQEQIKQLELKHSEIAKDLARQNIQERETHTLQLKSLSEQLQNLVYEEQQIRAKLASSVVENHSLEMENQSHIEQISKLKISNNQLLMQVQMLAAEHDEAVENDESENEQMISLVNRIKSLQAETALLRDQNDELTSELELMKIRNADQNSRGSTFHSKLINSDESEKSNSVTDTDPLAEQVPEFKNTETPLDSINFQFPLENWCQNVDDEKLSDLGNVISTIVNDLRTILIEKSACTSECAFRHNINDIITGLESQLSEKMKESDEIKIKNENTGEDECEERTSESLRDLVVNKSEKSKLVKRISASDDMINNLDRNFNNLDNKSSKNKRLRDYPPKKGDSNHSEFKSDRDYIDSDDIQSSDVVDGDDLISIRQDRDKFNALLKEQETKHLAEKKVLQDQCQELEKSLESLRTEYYRLEDYWAEKLDEERQLIEQEQKISDDKLGELISKIAEYEEQFSLDEKSRKDGRLSPVEEKFNLEQQYIDLEEEFEQFKSENEELISEKEQIIKELEEKILSIKEIEKKNIGIQIPEFKVIKRSSSSLNSFNSSVPPPNEHVAMSPSNAPSTQSVPKIPYYGINQKLFEPGKLNQIVENSMSVENDFLLVPPRINPHNYCCQQTEAYYSPMEMDVQKLLQKKMEIDGECNSLFRQKENLLKEIIELQGYRSGNFCSQGCKMIDINFLKSLTTKIQHLEHKKRNLQTSLKQHKKHSDRIFDKMCKQHMMEVADLHMTMKNTQERLRQQIHINTKHIEKLTKSDMLMKELYIENAYLKTNNGRLEEKCHMLTHFSNESTSV